SATRTWSANSYSGSSCSASKPATSKPSPPRSQSISSRPDAIDFKNRPSDNQRRGTTWRYFGRSDTGNSLCEAPPSAAPAFLKGSILQYLRRIAPPGTPPSPAGRAPTNGELLRREGRGRGAVADPLEFGALVGGGAAEGVAGPGAGRPAGADDVRVLCGAVRDP